MESNEFLLNWLIRYLKNKDLMLKRIIEIKQKSKNEAIIRYKNKERTTLGIASPGLAELETELNKQKKEEEICIATLHSQKNIDYMTKKWGFLTTFNNLSIILVNPFSKTEEKWIIKPAIHAKICHQGSLAKGFESISERIEKISEEEFNKKIIEYKE